MVRSTTIALLYSWVGALEKLGAAPLYGWLPDAMEGPTGQRLINAATMVTAGVYMVARSHAIFLNARWPCRGRRNRMAVQRSVPRTSGLVQTDIRKVARIPTFSDG